MIKNNNHIIARCYWSTSFNDKDKGVELQNAISNWSEHHMPRKIKSVFDVVCPEEQTLKIKSLELDLGVIRYKNLQEDLHLKLKEQLLLKLSDILMHPNKYAQSIEVVTKESTHLATLKYFLLKGVMPWNYQKIKGSINEIFEHQLLHNKYEMMHMIKVVGIHEYVRKRIAWQLKEENVKEIIKSLERSNDNYIIEFSEEFVKVQEREAMVKTGLHDFKKNLLFWILNYLFVERGTMFNKIEFVQSNIEQMAKHFNMEYLELFALIEEAVDKVHEHSYVKNNFILILSILSQKQQNTFYKNPSTKKQIEKQWQLLEHLLQLANNRNTPHQKKQLEELIHHLSIKNPVRFKEIITSLNKNSLNEVALSNNISKESLQILFETLSPTCAEKIINQIAFLEKLELEKHFKTSKRWLLSKGIQYLKKKNGVFSSKEFSNYIITELNKTQRTSKIKIFEKILNTPILTTDKSTETLSVFKELKQLYRLELTKEIPVFSEEKLMEILNELETGSKKRKEGNVKEKYYKILRVWLKEDPKSLWKILKAYEKQKFVKELLLELLDDITTVIPLFKKVFPKQYEILTKLELSIDEVVRRNSMLSQNLQTVKKLVLFEGIKILITKQKLDTTSFIKLVLVRVSIQKEQLNNKLYEELIVSAVSSFLEERQEFSNAQKRELKILVRTMKVSSKLEELTRYIKEHHNKQKEVAGILTLLIREKKINTNDFKKHETIISQYLLREGGILQENLIKEYQEKRNRLYKSYTTLELEKIITEIYWLSIADYQSYKGDKAKFETLFKRSVLQFLGAYKREKKQIQKNKKRFIEEKTVMNRVKLKRESFLVKEVVFHVKEAIQKGVLEIVIKKKKLQLEEVLLLLLEECPVLVFELLKDKSITVNQLEKLQLIISFKQFTALIVRNVVNNSLSSVMKDGLILYCLLEELAEVTKEIEAKFWNSIIQLIRGSKERKELKKLVRVVLEEFSKKEIKALEVVHVIKDKSMEISSVLRELLEEDSFAFELLEKPIKEKYEFEIITSKYKAASLEKLVTSLCVERKIPSWFLHTTPITFEEVLNDILRNSPLTIVSVLRRKAITDTQLYKLAEKIEVLTLIKILKELYPNQQIQLTAIEKLHKAIRAISIKNIKAEEIQQILLKKVLKSWVTSNWKLIGAASIWKELLWEVCTKKDVEESLFLEALESVKIQLPMQLQMSYNELGKLEKIKKTTQKKVDKQENTNQQSEARLAVGIAVPNAGVVLLNSYFLILFERLKLVEDNSFVSDEARLDAIHYLQYIVTGMTKTEESFLALNKVLCGVSLSQPIREEIQMLSEHKHLIEGLIEAGIGYWSAIGATSIQGFRGNWLVRNGVLREEEDRWSLIVEKRPYDILMLKSPFSFSIIKLPWMPKPLHVTWPF